MFQTPIIYFLCVLAIKYMLLFAIDDYVLININIYVCVCVFSVYIDYWFALGREALNGFSGCSVTALLR